MEQPTTSGIKNYQKRALDIILDEEEDMEEEKDSYHRRKQDTLRGSDSVHSSFELPQMKMSYEKNTNQNLNQITSLS